MQDNCSSALPFHVIRRDPGRSAKGVSGSGIGTSRKRTSAGAEVGLGGICSSAETLEGSAS